MTGRGGQWQGEQSGVQDKNQQGRGEITEPDDSLIIIDMMCSIHYTDYLL